MCDLSKPPVRMLKNRSIFSFLVVFFAKQILILRAVTFWHYLEKRVNSFSFCRDDFVRSPLLVRDANHDNRVTTRTLPVRWDEFIGRCAQIVALAMSASFSSCLKTIDFTLRMQGTTFNVTKHIIMKNAVLISRSCQQKLKFKTKTIKFHMSNVCL